MLGTEAHPAVEAILRRYSEKTIGSRDRDLLAKKVLPGGDTRSLTYFNPHPACMDRGEGCCLYDVDGNSYLDLLNNYTSLIHGHVHPPTMEAIREQLQKGTVLGAPGETVRRHAEYLTSRVPSLERVRYANSGTEATMFAIRAARVFTGRDGIVKMEGGYHGTHDAAEVSIAPDWETPGPPRSRLERGAPRSVLEDVYVAPFNDPDGLEEVLKAEAGKVAAIIVEPLVGAGGMIPPRKGYLRKVRELADRYGVLLIFDEIISFRLSLGGLQEKEGVAPDLTTLGKIIGGGLPVGAFGGKADIMAVFDPASPDPVSHSGTFNGSDVVLAAGLATLKAYEAAEIERINRLGESLRAGFREALERSGFRGSVGGSGSLSSVHWTTTPPATVREAARAKARAGIIPALIHLELLNQGVYSAPRGMFVISTPMTGNEVDFAVEAFGKALETVRPYIRDKAPQLLATP